MDRSEETETVSQTSRYLRAVREAFPKTELSDAAEYLDDVLIPKASAEKEQKLRKSKSPLEVFAGETL